MPFCDVRSMSKDQYKDIHTYLSSRRALVRLLDFFATKVVYAYVALPFCVAWFKEGRQFIAMAGVALVLGWGVLVQLIAYLFPHKRPYQQFAFKPLAGKGLFSRIDTRYDSFPSGHTTALTILTLIMALYSIPLAIVSVAVVLLTMASRVLLGYHYPTDTVGGFFIAAFVVLSLQYSGFFGLIMTLVK